MGGPSARAITYICMKIRAIRFVNPFIAVSILMTAGVALGRDGEALRPKLTIDSRDPDRNGPLAGYAAIVDRVSPSVVSIVVESRQEAGRNELPEELFNDPFFRRFFEGMRPDSRQFRQQQPKRQAEGSGVVVTSDGFIVTNNHVVDGADKIEVILANGRDKFKGKVVGRDAGTDVALIKIDAKNLTPATLGDSSKLKVGDTVLAIGSPFGLSQTVTTGIVSALKRSNLNITEGGYESFIQTDASINPGNSGGPLIDHQGRVVGINTAIFGRAGGNIGIGFAIPINMAVEILDRLQTKGEVERGYLGIWLGELTPDLAEGFGIEAHGVLVNEVQPGTPAEKAGFKRGDVVLAYQGEEVNDVADLRMRVANTQPGTDAKFDILREGKRQTLTAKIEKKPADENIASRRGEGGPSGGGRSQEFLPGVQIVGLTDDLRSQFNIPAEVKGVVIREVDANSAAADAGLTQGSVIQAVGRREISSVADAVNALREVRGKKVVLYVYDGQISRYVTVNR
jgi:serine protease Do